MREKHVAVIIQRAREKFPDVYPRIISDRGPQFVAKEFKSYIRICGMSHVLTSPHYPQSNGKKERWFRTLKAECIRRKTPLSLEEARRIVAEFVEYYSTKRLHFAIGYIAPVDKLNGREEEIFASRDRNLRMPVPEEKPIDKVGYSIVKERSR
jgi:putative transposase